MKEAWVYVYREFLESELFLVYENGVRHQLVTRRLAVFIEVTKVVNEGRGEEKQVEEDCRESVSS